MADFFEDKSNDVPVEDTVVEKIKIGDEEFDPEELKGIVDKGRFAKEVEEKYNTKIDKVWPEYTKATQELKTLREEKAQWESKRQEEIENAPSETLTEDELAQQARMQAKKLGLITVDDIDSYVTQKITSIQQATEILDDCRKLEGEYSGEDGRPKFDTEEVLNHMKETGIRSPVKAYKDKYEDQLDKWKESQLLGAKKKSIYTEDGLGGNHEPSDVKLTRDNLEEALRDVFNPKGGE
jgi:hypothetical protein